MRGLLVVNPHATATTAPVRDVLARALGSVVKVDVAVTSYRGHAVELAAEATRDGLDVVVALGGDGTVNEVVNGLFAGDASALAAGHPMDPYARPALAVVPGGSTNVFVRALGSSRLPVDATGEICEALRTGRERIISLGAVNGRLFTFCAGVGLDAEVVDRVERQRAAGKASTSGLYVRSAIRHFFFGTDRRNPALTLHRPGHDPVPGLHLGIIANTAPWTYLGRRPVNPCPTASFERGLELFAKRRLGTLDTVRAVRQMLAPIPRLHGRDVVRLHDATRFTLVGSRPVATQVDGDYLGRLPEASFQAVPAALRVVA